MFQVTKKGAFSAFLVFLGGYCYEYGMFRKAALIFILIFAPAPALASGVLINEIAWMGTEVSTADEWIELRNEGTGDVDLAGWRLEWRGGEYGITFSIGNGTGKCSTTLFPASGYFLLERTDDTTLPNVSADCLYAGALSNEGDIVVLKDPSGTVIDRIDGSNVWKINGGSEVAGNNTTKETAQRSASGWITASPTPRAPNAGVPASSSPSPPSSSGTSTPAAPASSSAPAIVYPAIKAYAGEDRTAIVGELVEFVGRAAGIDNKPLENARFWWNFGDGEAIEGRVVSHIFRITGTYTVGLHVSSAEYAASDYLRIEATPNQIVVKNVLIGEGGSLRLKNEGNTEVEIGGWILEDADANRFQIPPKTRLAEGAEVSFASSVTGLFRSGGTALKLYYPNSKLALEWKGEKAKTSQTSTFVEEKKLPVMAVSPPAPMPFQKNVESVIVEETKAARDNKNTAQVSNFSAFNTSVFFIFAIILSVAAAVGFLVIKKFYF